MRENLQTYVPIPSFSFDLEALEGVSFTFPTILRSLKISQYNIFPFSTDRQRVVHFKRLSTDLCSAPFFFLKDGYAPASIRKAARSLFLPSNYLSSITRLKDVTSAYDGDRRAYIQKNIVERQFPGNEVPQKLYFGSG